ncbi:MAG: four-carbon acid sugar kinase family protein [Planctomycetota bacterium]|nr:four-carbon acid sugar kinase family protein [Planctomycetota bacterium]
MAPSPRVGIVADDLTSAADAGGPLVEAGLDCRVGCGGHVPETGSVRSVDTRSRSFDVEGAARATREAVEALDEAPVLLKTVDSTLRGHLRSELSAAVSASRRLRVCFAPAFPQAGRTTVDGRQLVHGRPLLETSYADDPVHPARCERLAELVDSDLGAVRSVHAREGWPRIGGERVLLVDAERQEELDEFVAEARGVEDWLWVGSPGLAQAWGARLARVTERRPVEERPLAPVGPGRVLVAVGSLNRASRRQLEALRALEPAPLVLSTPEARGGDPAQHLAQLVEQAKSLAGEAPLSGLIATGGATMDALLGALAVTEFELLGEVEPGFPLGRAGDLRLALKAGGFGDDHALLRAVRILRGESPA